MSDETGGAVAPAAPHSAPIETPVTPPAPISTEPVSAPEPKPETKPAPEPEKKPEPTAREALQRAAEKVAKGEGKSDAKPAPKPEAKTETAPVKSDGPTRSEDGKFAPKEGEPKADTRPVQAEGKPGATEAAKTGETASQATPKPNEGAQPTKSAHQAPARFSPDAKTAWEAAPEPVRAEVARMERELTEGLSKYKNDAKEFDEVRSFAEMAKKNGTSLPAALQSYGKIETAFGINPIAGHIAAAELAGHDFRKVAEAYLGQTHDQIAAQTEARVQQHAQAAQHWERQARELHAQVQQFRTQQAETETQTAQSTVEAFAADKPRFDELRPTMAALIKNGMASELGQAYAMADRLMPDPAAASPAPTPAPAPAPAIDLTAQTRKGEKSITGAPTSGSNPAARQPSSSIKESLRRALAQAG